MKVFEDMKTNKIFIAFFFALCALPVAAQVVGDDLQYELLGRFISNNF